MERKLVRQGENALTTTLPREWILLKGLVAGDVVSMAIDEQHNLVLSSRLHVQKKRVTLHFEGLVRSQCWILLQTVYINGYDEITITHNGEQNLILQILDELIGMSIKSVSERQIVAYSLIATPEDSYEHIRKRVIYLFKEHVLMVGIKSHSELKHHENLIDKQIRYAVRYLTKYVSRPQYYDFLEMTTFEQACDIITDLSSQKVSKKQVLRLHSLVTDFVDFHVKKDFEKTFSVLYSFKRESENYCDGLLNAFVECLYNYLGIMAHTYQSKRIVRE
jgi:hypothetical protein